MPRPEVVGIFSQSLTGQLALRADESNEQRIESGLTTPEDRRHFQKILEELDAVLCTRATMMLEKGALRNRMRAQIPWFVACQKRSLPRLDDLSLWHQRGVPVMGLCFNEGFHQFEVVSGNYPSGKNELRGFLQDFQFGVQELRGRTCLSWEEFVDGLAEFNLARLGVLGGPSLLSNLLAQGRIDRLEISLTPSLAHGESQMRLQLQAEGIQTRFCLNSVSYEKDTVFLSYLRS